MTEGIGTSIVRGVLFETGNTLCDRDRAFRESAERFARERLEVSDRVAVAADAAALVAFDAGGYGAKEQ